MYVLLWNHTTVSSATALSGSADSKVRVDAVVPTFLVLLPVCTVCLPSLQYSHSPVHTFWYCAIQSSAEKGLLFPADLPDEARPPDAKHSTAVQTLQQATHFWRLTLSNAISSFRGLFYLLQNIVHHLKLTITIVNLFASFLQLVCWTAFTHLLRTSWTVIVLWILKFFYLVYLFVRVWMLVL